MDPVRFVAGLIDVLAAALDTGGPQDVITLIQDDEENTLPELLDGIWQMEHPRLAEVLEAIGGAPPRQTRRESGTQGADEAPEPLRAASKPLWMRAFRGTLGTGRSALR